MIKTGVVNRLEWCKTWVNAFQGLDFIDLMMLFFAYRLSMLNFVGVSLFLTTSLRIRGFSKRDKGYAGHAVCHITGAISPYFEH